MPLRLMRNVFQGQENMMGEDQSQGTHNSNSKLRIGRYNGAVLHCVPYLTDFVHIFADPAVF